MAVERPSSDFSKLMEEFPLNSASYILELLREHDGNISAVRTILHVSGCPFAGGAVTDPQAP